VRQKFSQGFLAHPPGRSRFGDVIRWLRSQTRSTNGSFLLRLRRAHQAKRAAYPADSSVTFDLKLLAGELAFRPTASVPQDESGLWVVIEAVTLPDSAAAEVRGSVAGKFL